MKSEIFSSAISSRYKLKFLYKLNPIELEPYYLSVNRDGKKVIYGRVNNTNEVKMFEFNKIFNIRIIDHAKFSPIIPIMPILN